MEVAGRPHEPMPDEAEGGQCRRLRHGPQRSPLAVVRFEVPAYNTRSGRLVRDTLDLLSRRAVPHNGVVPAAPSPSGGCPSPRLAPANGPTTLAPFPPRPSRGRTAAADAAAADLVEPASPDLPEGPNLPPPTPGVAVEHATAVPNGPSEPLAPPDGRKKRGRKPLDPAVRAARQAARLTLQRAPRAEKLRPRREAGEIPPASAPLPAAEPEPEPELAVEVEADRAEPAERPSSSRRSGSVPRSEASVSSASEWAPTYNSARGARRKRNQQPREVGASPKRPRPAHPRISATHLYIPRPPPALPGLACPEPGEVPLTLEAPPRHPLPAGVAALCHAKVAAALPPPRWGRVVDHLKLCGGRWLYYVHYAGTDRRFDEWVDQERLELASATFQPPADMDERAPPTRSVLDRRFSEILQRSEKHMLYGPNEYEESLMTKMKTVDSVRYGPHDIDCWYFAPYPINPQEAGRTLFVCEYCLKYMVSAGALERHYAQCLYRHPPGDEIYRDEANGISVFEVAGRTDRQYCQNLCLFAKLFLDHKTMHYDVQHFLFYVLCEMAPAGFRMVGYFSKEKVDWYNLACLLIVPPYQRKGYGRFLIEVSYELSRKEGRPGTPERPLSDLGRVSYFSFWKETLLRELLGREGETCTIKALSLATAIRSEDILHTLQALNCIHPLEEGAQTVIKVPPRLREEFLQQPLPRLRLDRANLHYCPGKHPKKSELRDRLGDGKG